MFTIFPLVEHESDSWSASFGSRAWDMSKFLNIQCQLSHLRYPQFARKWINIRKAYGNFYKVQIFIVSPKCSLSFSLILESHWCIKVIFILSIKSSKSYYRIMLCATRGRHLHLLNDNSTFVNQNTIL